MREMHAFIERVDRRYELRSRRTLEQSGVVPDAQLDVRSHRAGFAEVPLNQRELREGHA
jgi:hypothetical protein